jgi:hypothetical protein
MTVVRSRPRSDGRVGASRCRAASQTRLNATRDGIAYSYARGRDESPRELAAYRLGGDHRHLALLVDGNHVPVASAAPEQPAQEPFAVAAVDDDRVGVGVSLDAAALPDLRLEECVEGSVPPPGRIDRSGYSVSLRIGFASRPSSPVSDVTGGAAESSRRARRGLSRREVLYRAATGSAAINSDAYITSRLRRPLDRGAPNPTARGPALSCPAGHPRPPSSFFRGVRRKGGR